MTEKDRPHHHGNLREALIEAGIALLAEGGPQAMTLRAAAARAGVSHAAPAHHFKGLTGLMTAIATRSFQLFDEAMVAARDLAGPDLAAQLHAVCAGYLRFAEDRPALFRLLFIEPNVDRCDAALGKAGAQAYATLRGACAPFALSPTDALTLEATVWSLVHGYALLRHGAVSAGTPAFSDGPAFPALLANVLAGRNNVLATGAAVR